MHAFLYGCSYTNISVKLLIDLLFVFSECSCLINADRRCRKASEGRADKASAEPIELLIFHNLNLDAVEEEDCIVSTVGYTQNSHKLEETEGNEPDIVAHLIVLNAL